MKRAFLFLVTAAMLLIDVSPLWTQGEPKLLEEIWRRDDIDLKLNTVCKPARLAICYKKTKSGTFPHTNYLIDLRTGEEIYQTDPNTQRSIMVNYMGDKFYIYEIAEEKWKEFDTKTKEYIRDAYGYDPLNFDFRFSSPDNCFVFFDPLRFTFLFTDINTGIVKDSFQIEGKQDDPQGVVSWGMEFTPDSRYFNFSSVWTLDSDPPVAFQIYDRQTREIIFKRETPFGRHFRYQYFNTSNKIAFAEEVKLPGDDKVYSYIRIFDPDSRTIVKDIKISEYPYLYFVTNYNDTKIIYTVSDPQQKEYTLIYDLENDRLSDFKFIIHGGTLIADTNALYTFNSLALIAYRFDWTVGAEDAISKESNTIYPNPTNGIVSLNISPEYLMGKWDVSDMQGRILKKGLIGHMNILEINISNLATGTYFVTIIGTDNKQSHKIIRL